VDGGVSSEDPRGNTAVRATARQILTYQGRPAFTQFSASNGGWTAAGSVPYMPAEADPYDDWAGNYVHSWSVTVDAGRLERSYPSLGTLQRIQVTSRDGNGDWDPGETMQIAITDDAGTRLTAGTHDLQLVLYNSASFKDTITI
jgi:peptidoglycan hydrolase-like amidase